MKTYRVYYNREKDWPQMWSVDEGSQATEINVIGIHISGAPTSSQNAVRGTETVDSPFAWLQIVGTMTIEEGIAVFR